MLAQLVFAGDDEQRTRLIFQRSVAGVTIQADASAPNRLVVNRQAVLSTTVSIDGPAAGELWQMLLPQGRPVRSIPGVTVAYDDGHQVLALLLDAGAGTAVLLGDQQVSQAVIELIGPGAASIWASLQWVPPAVDEHPFSSLTDQEGEQDELLELLEQADAGGPDLAVRAAGAWRDALAALCAASRTGPPPEHARGRIARELVSVAEWLRAQTPRPPTARQAPLPVVEVGHDLRRRSTQIRVRLGSEMWTELGRPAFLHVVTSAGQVRFQVSAQPGVAPHYVQRQGRRVVLYCEVAELAGLAEGRYAATVVNNAIVIGAPLSKEDIC